MVGEKFPKDLILEPIVDGGTEVLPRQPSGERWEGTGWTGKFVGGRTFNFRLASGGNVLISVLVARDGTQAIEVPENLIEVDRVASGNDTGRRVTITYRLKV